MPLSEAYEALGAEFGLSAREVAAVLAAMSSSQRNREEIGRTALAVLRKMSGSFRVNLKDGQVTGVAFELSGREFERLSQGASDARME